MNDEVEAYRVTFRSEDLAELRKPGLFLKALNDIDEDRGTDTILMMESGDTRRPSATGNDAARVLDATMLLAKTPEVAEQLVSGLREMGRNLGVDMEIGIEPVTLRVDKIMQRK